MKGNCYEDALVALLDGYKPGSDPFRGETCVLVHGLPTLRSGEHAGEEYGHAWLECNTLNLVYDASVKKYIPRDMYYDLGNIKHTVKYTVEDAMRLAHETGHSGSWDEKIRGALHASIK